VLPIKDTVTLERLPVVTLALIAAGVAASFFLDEGGILVVAANALALWLFGPGVEDTVGRVRFVASVLAGALLSALAQLALDSSGVADAAAVGVIATVAGGHLALFPRGRILTASIVPFFFRVVEVPAVVFLALWCLLQAFAGPGLALVAGFAAGLVLARVLVDSKRDERGLEPHIPAY